MIDELIRRSVPLEKFVSSRPSGPYREEGGCIRFAPDSEIDRPLCNFTAQIDCDVVLDNGVDTTRAFEIMATHRGRTYTFTVPAERFATLNWVLEHLGASAIVYPGQNTKDHCKVAIQSLSGDIPTRREFTHTGWANIDGVRKFLTATGAIGPDGLDATIAVNLSERLALYALPSPPSCDELAACLRSSLKMLEVAPIEVTAPIYAGIWRAVMGRSDFALHLVAQTGAGKTALCALATQHFGPELDATNTPASWINTANANEAIGFSTKDVIFPIDDYAPSGTPADAARQQREAERLIRGTGNNQGRTRMRADATLRASKPVRGLPLISGEDTPRGESIRARMLIIDMDQNAMKWAKLSVCQRDAADGRFASAMSGFVQWLARDPERFDTFQKLRTEYRERATSESDHKRTPGIVADLGAGLRIFCDFTVHAGALATNEADELWTRVWNALTLNASRQAAHQAQSEPTAQFREYLISALIAGRAHLSTSDGTPPLGATQLGWRTVGTGEHERLEPRGDCVGWILPDGIFLEAKASYGAAQTMAQRSGETLAVSPQRLLKSMSEKGILLSTAQESRGTYKVRRRIGGRDLGLVHVSLDFTSSEPLSTQQPDKPDNDPENLSDHAASSMSGPVFEPDGGAERPDKSDNVQPLRTTSTLWKCPKCGLKHSKINQPIQCPVCHASRPKEIAA